MSMSSVSSSARALCGTFGGITKHLTRLQDQLLASHPKLQSSLDDVTDLLADVRVFGHQGILLEIDLGYHFVCAGNHFS